MRARLRIVAQFRRALASGADQLAATVDRRPADTLAAEILPLCEACRFLEREAASILAPARPDNHSRPVWLRGVSLEIRREPHGVILVIGPANYPILLPAVHILQALAAGNAVLLKPGRHGSRAAHSLRELLLDAGLDPDLLQLLEEDPASAQQAIAEGVDKVVLTGSYETGRAVLRSLADSATPAVMELSGDDPLFVLDDANVETVLAALRFATRLNGGNTCIAPRRIIVWPRHAEEIENHVNSLYPQLTVHAVHDADEALTTARRSPFALGAAVFGGEEAALQLAARIDAGVVVINDVILPTADPRLPFGGRRASGFGVTRGAEGLLEMTVIKAVAVRKGRWLPHLGDSHAADGELFSGFIAALHGGWRAKWHGLARMMDAVLARRKGN